MSGIKEAFANQKVSKKPKYGVARQAAGKKWIDPNLLEWPENDFRIFIGDLGNETNDEVLNKAFARFPTFNKAKVVRDKKTNKTKGFGFASFSDPIEGAKALREMDGKYVGNRPCKLRKSSWQERNQEEQRFVPGRKKNHIGGGVNKRFAT